MDVILYIVIGLAVAVVLFLLTGKKKAPSAPPEPKAIAPKASVDKGAGEPVEATRRSAERSTASTQTTRESAAQDAAKTKSGKVDEPSKEDTRHSVEASPPPAPSAERKRPDSERRPSAPGPTARKRDVADLRQGLAKSRETEGFFGRLRSLFTKKEISPELTEELEEILLGSDVGVGTTQAMLTRIRERLSSGELRDETEVWQALRSEAKRILDVPGGGPLALDTKPTVVLFVGVNGAGKTTTIGKLATKLQAQGKTCVLAAGDTFRAAASAQLVVWGQRVGCEVVKGKDGADPGSVIFDAVKKAQEHNADVVLADTAGRLHTKSNLMSEMQKIARTTAKALDGAPHEILLVIDSTNGQNAMAQAKEFKDALDLTGIVLTKLDGTAKGGVVLGISDALGLPVRFIGLGERPDDLHDFVPDDFIEALLGRES